MGVKLTRIRAGLYRVTLPTGDVEIRDTYSPSGPAHVRYPTLARDRWLVTGPGLPSLRFDRLRDAHAWVLKPRSA
jgi:hypothetical protein